MKQGMNKLQIQYSAAQFLFWVTACTCSGFVAIYLQYKGLSNTVVGVVTGAYNFLSIIGQPLMAKIIVMIPKFTVKKMIMTSLVMMAALFAFITVIPIPILAMVIIFVLINTINSSLVPLVNTFGLEYQNQNCKLNFGLARGIGSMGWAITSLVMGFVLARYSPNILGYVYLVAAMIALLVILSMKDLGLEAKKAKNGEAEKKDKGILRLLLSNRLIVFVILGVFFGLICHSVGTIFTINIVRGVGGTEAAAGVAQFFGAGSELVGMVAFTFLAKHMSSVKLLKICSVFFVVRFLLLLIAPNLAVIMISYALQSGSTGLYVPASVAFINEQLPSNKQTQAQSVFFMLTNGLAATLGCVLGGWLQDQFGLKLALSFCVACAVAGCICIFSRREK